MTLLDDALLDPLINEVQKTATLDLMGTHYTVLWPEAQVTGSTYEDMIRDINPDTHVHLAFRSPTAFKQGELDLPLPVPESVFQSWLSRWNDFCPQNRRIHTEIMDVIHTNVGIARLNRIQSREHDFGTSRITGFVGEVT